MISKEEYLKAKKLVIDYEKQTKNYSGSASDFLTRRKLSLTLSMQAFFNQNPHLWEIGYFDKYEKAMRYGYNLAIRRLKNKKL